MDDKNFTLESVKSGCVWGMIAGGISLFLTTFISESAFPDAVPYGIDPTSHYVGQTTFVVGCALFGGIIGMLIGSFGGLFLGGLSEFFLMRQANLTEYKWYIGVVATLYGTGAWTLLVVWSGVMKPCYLAYETLCNSNVPIPFSSFMEYIFVPGVIAALWSVVWSRRVARRYKAKLSGVNKDG